MKRSMSDQRGKEEWLKMEIDKTGLGRPFGQKHMEVQNVFLTLPVGNGAFKGNRRVWPFPSPLT